MNRKTISLSLLALGVILLIGALTIDLFWSGGTIGFGWKQTLGSVVGVILAVVGIVLYSRK